jgi:signal transduction histidine kinase
VLVLLMEGSELVVAAAAGQATSAGGRLPLGHSLAGDVVRSRHAVRVDDVERERGLDGAPLGVPDAAAALLVPLVYRGRALGVMCAFDRLDEEAVFDDDDEQLLRAFAASAATAVATAKSVEEGRLRTALEAAESERRRWARELHDETLQGLGALKMTLAAAARSDDPARMRGAIDLTVESLSREIDNLRAMITELRPASLDALGLVPALETLATRTESVHGLDVRAHFEIGRDGDGRLDPELETAVYRVAQEGLTNIAKHARAEHVDITLRRDGDRLRLAIADDGVGFDPSEPSAGFGLVGMAERVALVGGTLEIDAGQGGGVRLEATFPIAGG